MDDLISRQAAIDALEEPCNVPDTWSDEYAVGERQQWEKDVKSLKALPSAQENLQPTCNQLATDCISRQAAIDAVEKESQVDGSYGYMDTKSIIDLIEDIPSAQPERKVGKWVMKKVCDDGCGKVTYNCVCSECGMSAYEFSQPYCHRCGAKMNKL